MRTVSVLPVSSGGSFVLSLYRWFAVSFPSSCPALSCAMVLFGPQTRDVNQHLRCL